jgi:hypothetical protein
LLFGLFGSVLHTKFDSLCNQCLWPLTLWVRISLRRGVIDTTLCHKVCKWFAAGRWVFSLSGYSGCVHQENWHIGEIGVHNPRTSLIHLICNDGTIVRLNIHHKRESVRENRRGNEEWTVQSVRENRRGNEEWTVQSVRENWRGNAEWTVQNVRENRRGSEEWTVQR